MTKELFFDTDCLSSFLWINHTNLLEQLYGGTIIIPGPVYQELSNPCIPRIKARADDLIENGYATIKNIDIGKEEYEIYEKLTKNPDKGYRIIGKGEAAGIALAKVYGGVLASNNLRDVVQYVDRYNLKHIDTGHILLEGLKQKLITEDIGNTIWAAMLAKNRKLPTPTFTDYINRNNDDV